MRALFFLLLLANLVFFAWHAGYIGPAAELAGEPARLTQQIAPEKIRIISADEAKKLSASVPKPFACVEWGSFPQADFERVQDLLAGMNPAPKFSVRKVDETAGWWVFVPPLASKAAADRRGAELKGQGVAEFFVITEDGPNRFAISLGVFKTEEGARNYVDTLVRQGVKNARAAERETRLAKSVLVFREADDSLKAKLAELYEHARYAPPGELLSETEMETARRDLRYLAGVSAA